MFVDLSDTRKRTEMLQEMLRYLSFAENEPLLRVSVSGNYDQPTEDAVRYYQQSRSLPVTGITDRRTWEMLADEYAYEKRRRQSVTIEPIPTNPDYVTGAAERSDTVLILQIMLRALAVRYDYPILPPLSAHRSLLKDRYGAVDTPPYGKCAKASTRPGCLCPFLSWYGSHPKSRSEGPKKGGEYRWSGEAAGFQGIPV